MEIMLKWMRLLQNLKSDKATVELNAEQSGILKIIVEEGEDVEIGAVVASIDTSAEPPAEKAAPAQKESTQAKEEPAP
jgi:2-oxoglutarate dehydrogenase E2 component (dihydrolipoamide succinyltransferase)